MTKLPKFTLSHNETKDRWDLTSDSTDRVVKTFNVKAGATKANALKSAVGGVGSVKIKKVNGRFQEERTYPRSKDPKSSPG